MISSLTIFRTSLEARGYFDTLFAGFFLVKGIPITLQLLLYVLVPLFVLSAYFQRKITYLLGWCCFILVSVLLFQPWDEAFVNLLHSYHFAEEGVFSFSALSPIEGTVDFLPYFVFGLFAKLKVPLEETLYLQGVFGGILCIKAGQKILKSLRFLLSDTIAFCIPVLYVPLLLNSAHGFTTLFFAAAILWAVYFILEEKLNLAWAILALVPLIRIEGIFFFLVLSVFLIRKSGIKKIFLALLPFLLLSTWRIYYFGSFLPVPLQYKSSFGELFFFAIGARNLLSDLIATQTVTALITLLVFWKLLPRGNKQIYAYKILIALGVCVLPYYSSGGDWFPPSWGRYLFPFAYFAMLLAASELARFFTSDLTELRYRVGLILILLFFFEALPSFGAYHRFIDYALAPRKILAEIRPKLQPALPYRVQYLSQVGSHLRDTTESNNRIATSEIATISYFAKRETIDLLGITNIEIAKAPLRETPSLWRRSPKENELPYLIFKRLNPSLIQKYKPEIIYAFDFQIPTLLKDVPFEEWNRENILMALKRWQIKFQGLTRPIYGDLDKLVLEQGYKPVVVVYANQFATLYFVSHKIEERHFAALKSKGFIRE